MDDISYLDPETIGGANLYAYCNNNPVMYVDPTGKSALAIILEIIALFTILRLYLLKCLVARLSIVVDEKNAADIPLISIVNPSTANIKEVAFDNHLKSSKLNNNLK